MRRRLRLRLRLEAEAETEAKAEAEVEAEAEAEADAKAKAKAKAEDTFPRTPPVHPLYNVEVSSERPSEGAKAMEQAHRNHQRSQCWGGDVGNTMLWLRAELRSAKWEAQH